MEDESKDNNQVIESVRGELDHLSDEIIEQAVEEFKKGRSLQDVKMKYDPNIAADEIHDRKDKDK